MACHTLDRQHKFLPTVGDFMRVNDKEIVNDNYVEEFAKDLKWNSILSQRKRNMKHFMLKSPIANQKLKNVFSYQKWPFRRNWEHVKAVDDVSFDVYPGETQLENQAVVKQLTGRTISV